MKLITINSGDIFWKSKLTFCFSSEIKQQLSLSIKKNNIISPPILYPLDNGQYMIVCGWKRLMLLQAKTNDVFAVSALVLPKQENYQKKCFDFALEENLSHRNLSLLEKAEIVFKLKNELNASDKDIFTHYFPLLSLNRGVKILKEMLFLATLSDEQKQRIINTGFNAEYLTPLASYPAQDSDMLVDISLELNLGLNFIKEISLGISEIALRENQTGKEILFSLLEDAKSLPRREKIEYLRKTIYQKRYPQVFAKTKTLEQIIKDNAFLPQIKISTPSSFEGSKISIGFAVSNEDELKKYLKFLQDAVTENKFEKIWNFMKL